jgi:hypothetical protein
MYTFANLLKHRCAANKVQKKKLTWEDIQRAQVESKKTTKEAMRKIYESLERPIYIDLSLPPSEAEFSSLEAPPMVLGMESEQNWFNDVQL